MSDDVLITPASRKIEFKDSSGNVDGKIELNSSGDLNITAPGGGLNIGDTSADVYIGDGSANVDIILEQNGEIRGTTGRTVTLGQSDSNITVNALNFNTSTSTLFKSQNGITSTRLSTITGGTSGQESTSTAPHTLVGSANANTQYALLATLPATSNGTLDHITIEGAMGIWNEAHSFRIKMGRRDNFTYDYTIFDHDPTFSRASIVAYQASNGTVTIHAKLNASQYGKITYTITHSYQATVVDKPSLTTSTPAGTLIFDSDDTSTYPPTMRFPDNQKLQFGAGSDLNIYHSGTNSFIQEGGTGDLYIQSATVNITDTSSTPSGKFIDGGAVELYHNGTKKFETLSTGIEVTGDVTINNGTNKQVFINANDGNIEITRASGGAFIDFKNSTSEDYDARLQESSGHINLNGNAILTTGNASTPITTTSSSDADHVLINDGGVMKKITPTNLGIGSGGGGGGASNLNGLSDVTISSVQNNDLLKYNSTAGEWQNTNLGLSVTPTLSLNSGVYYSDQTAFTFTVTNHSSYDLPAYSVEVRRADNNNLIFNMQSGTGSNNSNLAISLETDQVPPDGRPTGVINVITSQSASNFDTPTTDNFKVLVTAQDFGDLQSEVATLNVSVVARPQVAFTTSTYRYWRITDMGERVYLMNWRAYSAINQGGTEYPGTLTSTTNPTNKFTNSWTSDGQTNVASSNHAFSETYTAMDMFDSSPDSSGYWSLSPTTTSYWNTTPTAYDYEYIELIWDMGTSRQIKSMEFKFNDQYTDTVGSNDNTFIIQGSNDNTNWTTVCTVTDSDQDFSASSGTTTVKVSDTS